MTLGPCCNVTRWHLYFNCKQFRLLRLSSQPSCLSCLSSAKSLFNKMFRPTSFIRNYGKLSRRNSSSLEEMFHQDGFIQQFEVLFGRVSICSRSGSHEYRWGDATLKNGFAQTEVWRFRSQSGKQKVHQPRDKPSLYSQVKTECCYLKSWKV